MVGDAYDVAVLLDCLRAVCDDSEEGPDGELVSVISDETRGLLVTAFRQLLCAFSIAETAHNAEYAVSGPRKDCLVGVVCTIFAFSMLTTLTHRRACWHTSS